VTPRKPEPVAGPVGTISGMTARKPEPVAGPVGKMSGMTARKPEPVAGPVGKIPAGTPAEGRRESPQRSPLHVPGEVGR
jgi:hypothetical protein